jgi:hypothetical protein
MLLAILTGPGGVEVKAEIACTVVAQFCGRRGGRPRNKGLPKSVTPTLLSGSESDSEISDTEGRGCANAKPLLPDYSPEFEAFWAAYPNKTAKGKAWDSWRKLRPTAAGVMAALDWQTKSAKWREDGGKYVPMPATYLNQRRWEDENPANNNGQRTRVAIGEVGPGGYKRLG